MGRGLRWLHGISALVIVLTMALGYGVSWGLVNVGHHIPTAFLSALVVVFTHSMTMFYFIGTGVAMRTGAASRSAWEPFLEEAARFRKRLAAPLGFAIVTLMAATILGGGSHTGKLPYWVHHAAALAALATNLIANRAGLNLIAANEGLMHRMDEALQKAPRPASRCGP